MGALEQRLQTRLAQQVDEHVVTAADKMQAAQAAQAAQEARDEARDEAPSWPESLRPALCALAILGLLLMSFIVIALSLLTARAPLASVMASLRGGPQAALVAQEVHSSSPNSALPQTRSNASHRGSVGQPQESPAPPAGGANGRPAASAFSSSQSPSSSPFFSSPRKGSSSNAMNETDQIASADQTLAPSAPITAASSTASPCEYRAAIEHVHRMGFSVDEATSAVSQAGGKVQWAIEHLLGQSSPSSTATATAGQRCQARDAEARDAEARDAGNSGDDETINTPEGTGESHESHTKCMEGGWTDVETPCPDTDTAASPLDTADSPESDKATSTEALPATASTEAVLVPPVAEAVDGAKAACNATDTSQADPSCGAELVDCNAEELVQMGFAAGEAQDAIRSARGDMKKAIKMLVERERAARRLTVD